MLEVHVLLGRRKRSDSSDKCVAGATMSDRLALAKRAPQVDLVVEHRPNTTLVDMSMRIEV